MFKPLENIIYIDEKWFYTGADLGIQPCGGEITGFSEGWEGRNPKFSKSTESYYVYGGE